MKHQHYDKDSDNQRKCAPSRGRRSGLLTNLRALTFGADVFIVFFSLLGSYWLRFETGLNDFGVKGMEPMHALDYMGHFFVGTIIMAVTLINFHLYTHENLLSFHRTLRILIKSCVVWFASFLGLTLMLKIQPDVSRIYSLLALVVLLVVLPTWRWFLWRLLCRDRFAGLLRQRTVLVGWNERWARAISALGADHARQIEVVGVVVPPSGKLATQPPAHIPVLGSLEDLESILPQDEVDVVLVGDLDLENHRLLELATMCEKAMVEFKLAPNYFRVLLSGLHLESVSGIPVLGISRLPLHSAFNQYVKRAIDMVGAFVGLVLSVPILAVCGALIYLESPGPIFYRQRRLGRSGQIFEMVKLRSMRLNAETGGKIGWTVKDDPRRLRIGTFMRAWNIDEIPQFWNVLKGEMSLVGPRPERPELIEEFKEVIPHYNARHNIKPGITGWAQVNGLRGDTDLSERVRFDLHYIENWNVFFDFQIMVMTFFKRENAC